MKMQLGVTKRGLFSSWLVISLIWVAVVGYRAWRDIPRDDWFTEPSTNQLSDVVNLLLYNPVARVIALDSIVLALAPPILALACGFLIWAVREAQRSAAVAKGRVADTELAGRSDPFLRGGITGHVL